MVEAITSPVTLAEVLVIPYRQNLTQLQLDFSEQILSDANTTCLPIDAEAGKRAAELWAKYNLSLTDAMQVAVALQAGCEAFLTNEGNWRRVTELTILVLDDLEL